MSYGWIKEFYDGSFEHGWDTEVSKKRASWSRGVLDGIRRVYLHTCHGSFTLDAGAGEYHQVDSLSATFKGADVTTPSTFINRRIAKKINERDVWKQLYKQENEDGSIWYVMKFSDKDVGAPIKPSVVNRWLVLEVDMKTGEAVCQIRNEV